MEGREGLHVEAERGAESSQSVADERCGVYDQDAAAGADARQRLTEGGHASERELTAE